MVTTSLPARPSGGLFAANLLCMLSMFLAAAGLPAADRVIPLIGAEQLTALRLLLAAAFLLPIWAMIEGPAALLRAPWLRGMAVGSLIALAAWFIILGQARSGPVTAAVATAMMPLFGIALEVVLDGRRLGPALILGLGLSCLGAFLTLDLKNGAPDLGIGALFCLCSIACFALGSRLTVTRLPALSAVGRASLTISGAALVALLVAAIRILTGQPPVDLGLWSAVDWGALLFFAIAGLGLSQLLWIAAVARLGIGMSSLHINAAPFYVMVILLALGGSWSWRQAGAAALVALGVVIAQGLLPLGRKR